MILDIPGEPNISTKVLKNIEYKREAEEENQRKRCKDERKLSKSEGVWEELDQPFLALNIEERGPKPKNAGSLKMLKKARKEILARGD